MEFEGRDPIDLNEEVLLSGKLATSLPCVKHYPFGSVDMFSADLSAVSQLEFSLTPVEQPPGQGVSVYTHAHTHTHTHVHTHAHPPTHTHTHTHTDITHRHTHTRTHTQPPALLCV